MQKHRLPPKPIHYLNAPKGHCRYCGEPLVDAKGRLRVRAAWHPGCLEAYKTIYWPGHTRKAVKKRDGGQCGHCNLISAKWHVDHIKPLIEARGDLDYWRMDNLMTLCIECHNKKTAAEATARAEKRRQQLDELAKRR